MNGLLIASLSLALVLTVMVLVHEMRLRRALETLLQVILQHWRQNEQSKTTLAGHRSVDDVSRDQRL
jgi:hypothetical protein